jgi:SAM-dependent methyltransferase
MPIRPNRGADAPPGAVGCLAAGAWRCQKPPPEVPVDAAEYALMDAAEEAMWWYRALRVRLLAALAERPGPGPALLDAGCGTGGFLRVLRATQPERVLHGIEYNPDAARRAAAKSGAAVAAGDINRLPFADAAFGAAVSVDVLCHRAVDEAAALAELHRVLAPGGTLVLNLPAMEWLRSAHDARVHTARRYTGARIVGALAAAGFQDIHARYWNSLLLPLMALQRKVIARAPDARSDVAAFAPWLDATLGFVTRVEHGLARAGLRFPAGGSVLAVARRP